jgi:hypothetical protein
MIPGTSSASDSRSSRGIAEPEEGVGFKEELGDRAVGPGIDLALQVVEIGFGAGGFGVGFGIGSDRDFKRRDLFQPCDQIGRAGIAIGARGELGPGHRRITAQRHDVPHADSQ